jgi:hypothetical protein
LILIGLLALGVEALRRQTAREYPNASRERSFRRMREWWSGVGTRAGAAPSRAALAGGPADARLDKLERLGRMRDDGLLDASEYTTEKAKILSDEPPA